jgi:hypothetical protein
MPLHSLYLLIACLPIIGIWLWLVFQQQKKSSAELAVKPLEEQRQELLRTLY